MGTALKIHRDSPIGHFASPPHSLRYSDPGTGLKFPKMSLCRCLRPGGTILKSAFHLLDPGSEVRLWAVQESEAGASAVSLGLSWGHRWRGGDCVHTGAPRSGPKSDLD